VRPSRWRPPGWLLLAALAALFPRPGRAFTNVAVGDRLEDVTLRTLDGQPLPLLSREATASVFVFFRPQQDHSLDALMELAAIQKTLRGRSVRWVGVVSDSWPADEVREVVRRSGADLPVLVDVGDRLYGKLGVRLHPVVGIADRQLRLAAYEHYRKINFSEIVLARIRVLLGDLKEADMAAVLEPAKATSGTTEDEARRDLTLARLLWKKGNWEKALEWARKSLSLVPSAGAYALQGEILAAQGQCQAALPLFEAALKIDPAEPVAQKGRGRCTP
jgi:tetratricopeptide (TPR) repeat protein